MSEQMRQATDVLGQVFRWLTPILLAVCGFLLVQVWQSQTQGMDDFKRKVDSIQDRLSITGNKIDAIDIKLNAGGQLTDLRITRLQADVDALGKRIDDVNKSRSDGREQITARIDQLNGRLEAIERQSYAGNRR